MIKISLWQGLYEIAVLKNFEKFTGEHVYQNFLLIKLQTFNLQL